PRETSSALDRGLTAGHRRGRRGMLLNGVNHVAILTNDSDRLHAFYRDVFDAKVSRDMTEQEGVRLSFVDVGPATELNVFEVRGNIEPRRRPPWSARGGSDPPGRQPPPRRPSTPPPGA